MTQLSIQLNAVIDLRNAVIGHIKSFDCTVALPFTNMATHRKIGAALRAGILADDDEADVDSSSDDSSDQDIADIESENNASDFEPNLEDLSNSVPAWLTPAVQLETAAVSGNDVNENAVTMLPSTSGRTKQMVRVAVRQAAKRSSAAISSGQPTSTRPATAKRSTAQQPFPYAQREWTNTDFNRDEIPDTRIELQIKKPLPLAPTELDYLGLYFDGEMVSNITEQSNLYATFRGFRRITKEGPLTNMAFWKFLGVLLYMSCIDLKSQRRYWQAGTRQSIVADSMTKNRFFEILRSLHFSDAAIRPPKTSALYDRAYPVRSLINLANERFR